MNISHFYQLVKKSVNAWIDDYAPSMGAAISYYTMFSIAPLLLIVIAVAGLVWGREAVQGQIVGQLSGLIGTEGATGVQALIESANKPAKGLVATAISIVVLVVGATTVFAELQSALDRIWKVQQAPKVSGIWATLRTRLLSLGFILGLGFLLMVSLVSSAALAAFGSWTQGLLPGWELLLQFLNILLSLGIATVLFAMIYKIMPQAKVGWHDVWIGAAATALLFEVGKILIGLYIGKSSITSSFAAAGSLVVLLVWVYYSAQIFLLGAEFTWVYANDHGSLASSQQAAMASPAKSAPTGQARIAPSQASAISTVRQTQDEAAASSQSERVENENKIRKEDQHYRALLADSDAVHASLKQRAIVYAGSAAALLALRMLLKLLGKKARKPLRLRRP